MRTRAGIWISIEILPKGRSSVVRWIYRALSFDAASSTGWATRAALDHVPWEVVIEVEDPGVSAEKWRLEVPDRNRAEAVVADFQAAVRAGNEPDDLKQVLIKASEQT